MRGRAGTIRVNEQVVFGFSSPPVHIGQAQVGLWNGQQSCSLTLGLQTLGDLSAAIVFPQTCFQHTAPDALFIRNESHEVMREAEL
jgi:hypothetical protein